MEKVKKLPEWFKGRVYDHGQEVENPFSGATYKLDNIELSMYDLIMGCNAIISYGLGDDELKQNAVSDLRKGLDWFREHNAEAYMKLLD